VGVQPKPNRTEPCNHMHYQTYYTPLLYPTVLPFLPFLSASCDPALPCLALPCLALPCPDMVAERAQFVCVCASVSQPLLTPTHILSLSHPYPYPQSKPPFFSRDVCDRDSTCVLFSSSSAYTYAYASSPLNPAFKFSYTESG
jgi:hypothetical protein